MKETELNVMGMSCPSCVRHIGAAVREIEGVEDVEVRVTDGRVVIRHAAGVQTAALAGAIRAAGYDVEA